MITISVPPAKQVDPARRISALRARRTMADKAGDRAKVAEYGELIAAIEDDRPDLVRSEDDRDVDPRRRLGALRALRSRAIKASNHGRERELDGRISALVSEYPGIDQPKAKPKSEIKDDDGEVDRSAVLLSLDREKDRLRSEIDRILRRSKERRTKKAA